MGNIENMDYWFKSIKDADQLYSVNRYEGNGNKTVWDVNFTGGYLSPDDIYAYSIKDGSVTTRGLVMVNAWQAEISPAIPAGHTLFIYRNTPKSNPLITFANASILNGKQLNTISRQSIFNVAEMVDRFNIYDNRANDALALSIEALAAAEHAVNTADDAKAVSDTANANATSAANTANAAKATADASKQVADNALSIANDAKATANSATGVSNEAQATANEALVTAKDAARKSAIAEATANEALSKIGIAEQAAKDAQAAAAAAELAVGDTLLLANKALEEVGKVLGRVDASEAVANAAKQAADEALALVYQATHMVPEIDARLVTVEIDLKQLRIDTDALYASVMADRAQLHHLGNVVNNLSGSMVNYLNKTEIQGAVNYSGMPASSNAVRDHVANIRQELINHTNNKDIGVHQTRWAGQGERALGQQGWNDFSPYFVYGMHHAIQINFVWVTHVRIALFQEYRQGAWRNIW